MASLTGKNIENKLNLMGKYNQCQYENTRDVKLEILKRKMINKLIIPILQRKWNVIYDNIFIINIYKKELSLYNSSNDDIMFYKNILTFIDRIYNEHTEISHLEKILYSNTSDGTRILYKTSMIRISTEYEIYHSLFGKPLDNIYDNDMMNNIRKHLKNDDITISEIKHLLSKEN